VRFTVSVNPSRISGAARGLFLSATLVAVACTHAGTAAPGATPGSASAPAPAAETRAVGVGGAADFLSGIPRCTGLPALITARDAREQPEGTPVAVRGVLLHNPKWDCPAKGCKGKGADGQRGGCCNTCKTRWFVVDPADAARPYMSRARLYPRAAGQAELMTLEAQDCEVAKVNAATPPKQVVVTGTFQGPAGEGGGSQLIADAQLCAP